MLSWIRRNNMLSISAKVVNWTPKRHAYPMLLIFWVNKIRSVADSAIRRSAIACAVSFDLPWNAIDNKIVQLQVQSIKVVLFKDVCHDLQRNAISVHHVLHGWLWYVRSLGRFFHRTGHCSSLPYLLFSPHWYVSLDDFWRRHAGGFNRYYSSHSKQ